MNKRILVTGAAGFIGFHLSRSLLDDGFEVYGIDNINDYYDVNLKNARLDILNNYRNFKFGCIDIENFDELKSVFEKFNPCKVINLAAQAGVRYSIENPFAYVGSNLVGFVNILELCRHFGTEGLIYASSSSVYGGNQKLPFSVDDRVDKPISLYAATKKANELIAYSYSHLYDLHTTGLRFFTVYGPWGRPDMAMYIFADKISASKAIDVYNNGKMQRDFTYIDDIINGVKLSIEKNYSCEVFNLGNSNSENLMDVVSLIEKNLNKQAIINYCPIQPGDVEKTFADIEKSEQMLGYKPTTNINIGVQEFISWYKKYNEKLL
ncbi:protein CapI [bacterium]|nr:protein CapI [bacterium]